MTQYQYVTEIYNNSWFVVCKEEPIEAPTEQQAYRLIDAKMRQEDAEYNMTTTGIQLHAIDGVPVLREGGSGTYWFRITREDTWPTFDHLKTPSHEKDFQITAQSLADAQTQLDAMIADHREWGNCSSELLFVPPVAVSV